MTTATGEHLTEERIASEQAAVRHDLARFVHKITNNCKTIAQKYQDFVNGEYPDAKPYLIYKANERLDMMAGNIPDHSPTRVVRQDDAPKPKKPKITTKEIVNWDMGRYIRQATDGGKKLLRHLDDMTDPPQVFLSANPDEFKYQKATQIKPHHEFAAAEELLKRGYGCQNPYAYYPRTSVREEQILQAQFAEDAREIADGIDLVTYMLHVIDNPKFNAWNEIITTPYTQTHRLRAIKHLLWRGIDIDWDHITHADIEQYYRGLSDKDRQDPDRLLSDRKQPAPLTPDQEASVLALLDQTHRQAENADRKAAKKAIKKAKKAAKKANTAKRASHDYNSVGNRNNAADKGNATDPDKNTGKANNAKDTAADTGENDGNANNADNDMSADANSAADTADTTRADTPASDRGATAVANALARHPQVDLDTALENHHATAGIPKENLTHEQIYDAITAEANFQKRQAIIQRRLHLENSDAPADGTDPKSRSP